MDFLIGPVEKRDADTLLKIKDYISGTVIITDCWKALGLEKKNLNI